MRVRAPLIPVPESRNAACDLPANLRAITQEAAGVGSLNRGIGTQKRGVGNDGTSQVLYADSDGLGSRSQQGKVLKAMR